MLTRVGDWPTHSARSLDRLASGLGVGYSATNHHRSLAVGGAGRWGHFDARTLRQHFAQPFSVGPSSQNGPRRQRVRCAAPNNGAPLTAPGRSELHLLGGEKGSFQEAAGNVGANGAKMAPFFTATDTPWQQISDSLHVPPPLLNVRSDAV